jgi:hypothetical protein
MGSEDYVEWFREPVNAKLPVYCRQGELGSRVVEAHLSREVLQKISKVGNQAEKATIRHKLTEAFGAVFTKLDGSQRGLMSKTSPVVGIAHALEAQQRAIQLLTSQLSSETQRREAAETHAQTMEEAFETLQLRITAQLPGSPPAVKAPKSLEPRNALGVAEEMARKREEAEKQAREEAERARQEAERARQEAERVRIEEEQRQKQERKKAESPGLGFVLPQDAKMSESPDLDQEVFTGEVAA